jgi:hypothetical protein
MMGTIGGACGVTLISAVIADSEAASTFVIAFTVLLCCAAANLLTASLARPAKERGAEVVPVSAT